ncbi:hypothetical protein [Dactylosporangium darangshiense]|uniref:Uncharacterized protein n=1 Tax=Dactylosporangium darangshiense TaxID=579108 RepID=A0ABP8DEA1_9ACTN
MRKPLVLVLVATLLAAGACNDDGRKTATASGPAPSAGVEPPGSPTLEPSQAEPSATSAAPAAATTTAPARPPATTRPATPPTTKAAAPPAATVTAVTLTLGESSFTGSCSESPVHVHVTWTVQVSPRTYQEASVTIASSDGTSTSARWFLQDGQTGMTSVRDVKLDPAHPHRVVDFWVQTTTPSRAQSPRRSFTVDCHNPTG